MTINSENFGSRSQILRELGNQAVRDDSWQDFCGDLAIALPQVPRPEKANFDSAHFNVLRDLPFFLWLPDNSRPRPASRRAFPTPSPG